MNEYLYFYNKKNIHYLGVKKVGSA